METISISLALCEENPSQRISNAEFWWLFFCYQPENAYDHTVNSLVIWDTMALMWHHCNVYWWVFINMISMYIDKHTCHDVICLWHVVSFTYTPQQLCSCRCPGAQFGHQVICSYKPAPIHSIQHHHHHPHNNDWSQPRHTSSVHFQYDAHQPDVSLLKLVRLKATSMNKLYSHRTLTHSICF